MRTMSQWLMVIAFTVLSSHAMAKAMSKSDYVTKVQTEVMNWETRANKLRADRNALPTTSDQFKKLDKAIANIDDELKDVRENLSELKASTSEDWSGDRKKIDKSLASLQHKYNDAVAE